MAEETKITDLMERVDDVPLGREYKMPPEDTWDGVIYKVVLEYNIPPYRSGEAKGTQTVLHIQLEPEAGMMEYEDGTKKPLAVRAYDSKITPIREAAKITGVSATRELVGKPIRVSVKHIDRKVGTGQYAKVVSFFAPRNKKLVPVGVDDQIGVFKLDREKVEELKESQNKDTSDAPF